MNVTTPTRLEIESVANAHIDRLRAAIIKDHGPIRDDFDLRGRLMGSLAALIGTLPSRIPAPARAIDPSRLGGLGREFYLSGTPITVPAESGSGPPRRIGRIDGSLVKTWPVEHLSRKPKRRQSDSDAAAPFLRALATYRSHPILVLPAKSSDPETKDVATFWESLKYLQDTQWIETTQVAFCRFAGMLLVGTIIERVGTPGGYYVEFVEMYRALRQFSTAADWTFGLVVEGEEAIAVVSDGCLEIAVAAKPCIDCFQLGAHCEDQRIGYLGKAISEGRPLSSAVLSDPATGGLMEQARVEAESIARFRARLTGISTESCSTDGPSVLDGGLEGQETGGVK